MDVQNKAAAFKPVFRVLRVIPALLFAIFLGGVAYQVRYYGGGPEHWMGPAILAMLFGVVALWGLVSAPLGRRKVSEVRARAEVEEAPAFDADAAIKRYLASKGNEAPPVATAPIDDAPPPTAPRPTFGRKRPDA